ncbi:MAG TPA: DUF222 domain-containing protein [Mycobacteriales bacterium]|jgi:hypothetical protein|nr:DUF222 domain-containing protein [Mycobacteriales bacterium]
MATLPEAVREYLAQPLDALSTSALGERVLALDALVRQAQAAQAAAVREFDRRGGADADGAASTTAWLRDRAVLTDREARSLLGLARSAERLPALAAAFREGAVSAAHVRVAAAAARPLPDDVVAAGDAFLTETARRLDAGRFAVVVRRWVATVAPAAFERDAERRYDARWLSVGRTFGGMRNVAGLLDPEGGAVLESAIDALVAANAPDDARTRDQQRADALVDLVNLATSHGLLPVAGGHRPEVVVHASPAAATGAVEAPPAEVAEVGPVTRAAFDRITCDSRWRRLLVDALAVPLELGRATRTVPPPLRKFVSLRDGHCRYPGCPRAAAFCEAHHVVHWRHGGRTDAANLVLLCRYHHHLVHDRGHDLALGPDCTVEVTTPSGRRLTSRARGPTVAAVR